MPVKIKLTPAEWEIMNSIWDLGGETTVRDVLEHTFPNGEKAYTTIQAFMNILEKKGFVGHKSFGNSHEYYPTIKKEEYTKAYLKSFVSNYFSDSYSEMVSFFTKDKDMSLEELEEIKKMIIEEIKKQKRDENE